jgi:hypothetical protein
MTTCNFACWIVSRPMTRSGRDWDDSAVRLVSRSSSELASVDIFFLILGVSSDMRGGAEADASGSITLLLNGQRALQHIHASFMNQVTKFYRRELEQALKEQAFGISCSELIRSNDHEAEATITLLEGNTINVVLSSAGHKVWRQWIRQF